MTVQRRLLSAAVLLGKLLAANEHLPAISWSVSPANMARHEYRTGVEGHVFYDPAAADARARALADLGQWAAALGANVIPGPDYHQKPDSELFEVVTEVASVPVHLWARVPREATS